MFASKYRGGISSKRILKAFEFLKKRSEEATLAAQREAEALEKMDQVSAEDSDVEKANETPTGDGEESEENPEESSYGIKRRRPPWERNAESRLPKGGAGLVSLMGDVSSMEQRIQGGWNLVIKAGGRYVSGVTFWAESWRGWGVSVVVSSTKGGFIYRRGSGPVFPLVGRG